MIKNLIVLPDGTEISSGTGNNTAITNAVFTDLVNDSEDLRLGSVCANSVEVSILAPDGLGVAAGDEIVVYKVDGTTRKKKGVYIIDKPTKPTAYSMKIIGFDRVTKLDKDLTEWLSSLNGWPYTLLTFANMVCEACGLKLVTKSIPNSGIVIDQFSMVGVTGRKLMRWIGECCCRFVRANADGDIELAWYTDSGVTLAPSGENYYFKGSYAREDFSTAPIEAVQIMFAKSDGYKWPEAAADANSYIIQGNPFLSATTDDNLMALNMIKHSLKDVSYTPCKVSVAESYGIEAGQSVQIVGREGETITAYVMKKTTRGQRADLECTGNARRDNSAALYDKSPEDLANDAVNAQTQADIFNKLTNYGKIQGIYIKDDRWYINAELAKIENLVIGSDSLPDDLAKKGEIPTNISQLLNDADYQNRSGVVTIVNGVVTADYVNALALKVKAANITGTLAVGQLPKGVAMTTEIPKNISQLINDSEFQNRTGVVTIVNGVVTADYVNALALKVNAANITGTLAVGQLPDNVALTSEIPTNISQLLNDRDYQSKTGVVSIVNGVVTADYVNALALKVKAANIEGTLAVGQLPNGVAFTTEIPKNISQLINDKDYQSRTGVVSIVNGVVTADYVNALALKVNAANITGTLVIGQLPAGLAFESQIPSKLTQLVNDSGYLTESGVVSVVDGRITADYVSALGISAKSLLVEDTSGNTLFSAGNNAVNIAGWKVNKGALTNGNLGDQYFIGLYSGFSNTAHQIGNVSSNRWRIIAGQNFGVTSEGVASMKNIDISGGNVKIPLGNYSGDSVRGYGIVNWKGVGSTNNEETTGLYVRPDQLTCRYKKSGSEMSEPLIVADGSSGNLTKLLFGTWKIGSLESSTQVTSDRNAKNTISDMTDKYSTIFDNLRPVSFRYNSGTSGRTHTGFIAQDVEAAVISSGLTTKDFAAVCYDLDEGGNKIRYGVRYEEIVALNTNEIQKLKRRLAELEARLAS